MIGEVAIGGVLFPALLLLGALALVATAFLSRLFQIVGFYRLVGFRPLVDCCLFLLVLGLLDWLTIPFGLRT